MVLIQLVEVRIRDLKQHIVFQVFLLSGFPDISILFNSLESKFLLIFCEFSVLTHGVHAHDKLDLHGLEWGILKCLPFLFSLWRSFTIFVGLLLISLFIFPLLLGLLLLLDLLIDSHVVLDSHIISFLKKTSHVLELDREIRSKTWHLVVVHVFVSHNLVNKDVFWAVARLVDNTRVRGVGDVVLEQGVGHTFVLLEDLVLDDILGGGIGVEELDLGLSARDVVSLVVLVFLETLFDTLDWLVNLTYIAGRSSGELSEVVNHGLEVIIKVIRVLDHDIELLDLVIELLLGKILLLLLLFDFS
jgi:hypothetical protein